MRWATKMEFESLWRLLPFPNWIFEVVNQNELAQFSLKPRPHYVLLNAMQSHDDRNNKIKATQV